MNPSEVSKHLNQIANYLDKNPKPNKEQVKRGLSYISSQIHTSADVKKFVQKEYDNAMTGLEKLISRLDGVAHSLNPQDPHRDELENSITMFEKTKDNLVNLYNSIQAQV